jgi:glutathione peroxidase
MLLMKLSFGIASGSIFELKAINIDGSEVSLSNYKGKVLLVVNTASRCGFTPQYKSLEKIYKKYKERDFVVLAFPSNDFRQELSTDEEIKEFCEAYELSFPIFAKGKVKGFEKQEVFKYLTQDSNGRSMGEIRWNFEKFLVSREGKLVKRFRSSVDPNQDEISIAIESLL